MLLICLSVAKLGLEILPLLPELLAVISGVSKLANVHENGSSTVDLTHVRLDLRVLPTYLYNLFFRKFLKGSFEDSSCFRYTEQLRNFGDIDVEGLEPLLFGQVIDHSVVDLYGMRVQSVFLLKLSVEKVKYLAQVPGSFLEYSLEHRPGPFDSNAIGPVSADELVDVGHPDVEQAGPAEVGDCKLKDPEGLLKVSIFPQKVRKVDEHNRSHATMIPTLLVGQLQALKGAEHHLQVDVKLPDIGVGLEQLLEVSNSLLLLVLGVGSFFVDDMLDDC